MLVLLDFSSGRGIVGYNSTYSVTGNIQMGGLEIIKRIKSSKYWKYISKQQPIMVLNFR
jgi:hypothetical protein